MTPAGLARRLGTGDAVVVGLSAMIGAGVFAAFPPAAAAAGGRLPAALGIAAVVAYCNAISSARLAARYPASGGTYVYGRRRLGDLWGFLAGWGFVVGKTASCAAMALTVGAYLAPGHARLFALAAVAALTGLNLVGVHKSMLAARTLTAAVIAVLLAVVAAGLAGHAAAPAGPGATASGWDVLQAAGLLFFAFAGYARIATLGEEVREPERVIPRAILWSLTITLLLYAAVAATVLHVLGPARLAAATAPLVDAVTAAGAPGLAPVVRAGAAAAALGSLLALILGVSRTVFAMARDRHLPAALDAVSGRHGVPHRAEAAVGVAVAALVVTTDLRGAIGFSSFGVLGYYAVANAAALTLRRDEGAPWRPVPVLGLAGCLVLAATLPTASVLRGLAVFAVGALVWLVTRRRAVPAPGR
ncbi:APC family permease [Krasilnikovia sp. M28-CT-15]|uniref:APC family permease n=1 Tax=Krasilnikovia sp. M28-CT-15 TaxID=3373540 RepID=UPI0038776C60